MRTINIFYISSSGRRFDLKAAPIRIKAANFHNYSWRRETVALQYGERVVDFGKKAQTYQTTLYLDQDPEALATLHAAWEQDILSRTPGRVVWNNQYIECYIASSSTYPTTGNAYIANEIEIYCPVPLWFETKHFLFYSSAGSGLLRAAPVFLDYPYGYDYDYAADKTGTQLLWGENPGIISFKAILAGRCTNPTFTIDGHTFGVTADIAYGGDSITIDTRASAKIGEQVYRGSGESKTNLFHLRIGEIEPFIGRANGKITWSRDFAIDLTVYIGRSEPSWL